MLLQAESDLVVCRIRPLLGTSPTDADVRILDDGNDGDNTTDDPTEDAVASPSMGC